MAHEAPRKHSSNGITLIQVMGAPDDATAGKWYANCPNPMDWLEPLAKIEPNRADVTNADRNDRFIDLLMSV